MKRKLKITEAEWEVMAVVWKKGEAAASEALEALAGRKSWTLATVRTLLGRLVRKGALEQKADGKRFLYSPRVSLAECVRQESDSFLDRVLGRAPSGSIVHLVRRSKLTKEEIEELRRILREKENP